MGDTSSEVRGSALLTTSGDIYTNLLHHNNKSLQKQDHKISRSFYSFDLSSN